MGMFSAPRLTRNDGIIISTFITFHILSAWLSDVTRNSEGPSSRHFEPHSRRPRSGGEQPVTYATLDVARRESQPVTYATLDVALWESLLNEVFDGNCDEYRDYKVKPPESRAIIAQVIINLHEPFLSDFVAKWESSGDVDVILAFGPISSIPLPPNYVRDFAVNERFSVFRN